MNTQELTSKVEALEARLNANEKYTLDLAQHAEQLVAYIAKQQEVIGALCTAMDNMDVPAPASATVRKSNTRVLAPHDEFVRVRTEMLAKGLKPSNEEVRIEWLRTREAKPAMAVA